MIVYKYMTFESAFQVLKNQTLAFRNFSTFNDLFDGHTPTEEITTPYSHALEPPAIMDIRMKKRQGIKNLIRIIQDEHIAICLSLTNTSTLMWTHYAQSCKGIVLGFDANEMFNNIEEKIVHNFEPVLYHSYIKDIHTSQVRIEEITKIVTDNFLRKTPNWSYEDEIRMVIRKEDSISTNDMHFIPFNAYSLRSITLGYVGWLEDILLKAYIELKVIRGNCSHIFRQIAPNNFKRIIETTKSEIHLKQLEDLENFILKKEINITETQAEKCNLILNELKIDMIMDWIEDRKELLQKIGA